MKITSPPLYLKDEYDILEYVIETNSEELIEEEMILDEFRGYEAKLLEVEVSKINPSNPDNHLMDSKKQIKLNKVPSHSLPPILLNERLEVIDGHHRLRAHIHNEQQFALCLVLRPKD